MSTKLDPKSKFKLLDYFDTRPVEVLDELNSEANQFKPKNVELLLNDEVEYLVWDDFFVS